jgi:UDP-N-acetylmuramyl pentapeptide synthase
VSGGAFPRGATLRTLSLEVAGSWVAGDDSVFVTDVRHDSRAVEPGDLFVARQGQRSDGRAYVAQAVARGAIAVLAEAPVDAPVPTLVAPDVDRAMAWASSGVWAHPTWSLDVVAARARAQRPRRPVRFTRYGIVALRGIAVGRRAHDAGVG